MGVKRKYKFKGLLFLIIVTSILAAQAKNLETIIDLDGRWYFSIGDYKQWAEAEFDHTTWESINVPSSWERQGFNGYDGYAWYRKAFFLEQNVGTGLLLSVGYIDDVDEVYINGILIGQSGSFPPNYRTAYNANRLYSIPPNVLKIGAKNIIAVRVYDAEGEGGIVHGTVALMKDKNAIPVDFEMQGKWKFRTGDIDVEKITVEQIKQWDDIVVPGYWEDQGYKDYDGVACYAYNFELSGEFDFDSMVLLLGKIDDLDQVYLNGKLVGQSGEFNRREQSRHSDMANQLRGYYLTNGVLKTKGSNLLVVKVYDSWGLGGIYEGSIGLIKQKNYINFWRERRSY